MLHPSAMTLYQSRLDPMTDAIMAGDVAGFLDGLHLPHMLRTLDSEVLFETEQDLRQGAGYYLNALQALGITRLERTCESAIYKSATEIEGYNSVRAYSGNTPAIMPFLARMRLELRDGEWRISETDMAVLRSKWSVLPQIEGQVPSPENAPKDEADFNLACFQVLLNWLSQAALSKNFDAWASACATPLTVTGAMGTVVHETLADLRNEFDLFVSAFKVHHVTDIVRTALAVRTEGETRMVGTCRTYLVSQANMVVDPYVSQVVFERPEDGFWKLVRLENAIGHKNWRSNGDLPRD